MTIRDIIQIMKDANMDVSFYVRKDGGIRITKINGKSFSGSKGNVEARKIVGATLSEARIRQLAKLKTPKGKGSYNKRRRQKLDEETKKEIRRLQRLYRKNKTKSGAPTQRNYRYVMEHYGKKEADRLLKQSDYYARGVAYDENVDALIARLESDMSKLSDKSASKIRAIIDKLESMKGILREEVLGEILDTSGALYRWEKGEINVDEFARIINQKLDSN